MNTKDIVSELIALDPSLKEYETQLPALIAQIVAAKPNTRFDSGFAKRLKRELLSTNKAVPVNTWRLRIGYAIMGAIAAVAISVPSMYYVLERPERLAAVTDTVVPLQEGAFGRLTANTTSSGSATAQMGFGGGSASAVAPAPDAKMIAPGMPPQDQVAYEYAAPDWEMPAPAPVYRRAPFNAQAVRASVRVPEVPGIKLNSFSGLTVRSMELVQNTADGYAVQMNADEGGLSIYQNWTQWEQPQTPLDIDHVLSDEKLLQIARAFVADHGIDMKGYGEPMVEQYWRDAVIAAQQSPQTQAWLPEDTGIVFPLRIASAPVVDDSGSYVGLHLQVNHRHKKVTGAYGIMLAPLESSQYAYADKPAIDAVIKRGGLYAWQQEGVRRETLTLGAPESVYLLQYIQNEQGVGQQLFVPALRFPVQGNIQPGMQRYVHVPLAKEIIDSASNQPVPTPYPLIEKAVQ